MVTFSESNEAKAKGWKSRVYRWQLYAEDDWNQEYYLTACYSDVHFWPVAFDQKAAPLQGFVMSVLFKSNKRVLHKLPVLEGAPRRATPHTTLKPLSVECQHAWNRSSAAIFFFILSCTFYFAVWHGPPECVRVHPRRRQSHVPTPAALCPQPKAVRYGGWWSVILHLLFNTSVFPVKQCTLSIAVKRI